MPDILSSTIIIKPETQTETRHRENISREIYRKKQPQTHTMKTNDNDNEKERENARHHLYPQKKEKRQRQQTNKPTMTVTLMQDENKGPPDTEKWVQDTHKNRPRKDESLWKSLEKSVNVYGKKCERTSLNPCSSLEMMNKGRKVGMTFNGLFGRKWFLYMDLY